MKIQIDIVPKRGLSRRYKFHAAFIRGIEFINTEYFKSANLAIA